MSGAIQIRCLQTIGDREIQGLGDVLIDCVEGGASVSFMLPMSRAKADAFWRSTAASVARGERVVLAAEDETGAIVGTVQIILAQPENQPHRGDLAKMLVHRRARRRGVGASSSRPPSAVRLDAGKTLLVLDTASARCRAPVRPAGVAALRRDPELRAAARRHALCDHVLLQVAARLTEARGQSWLMPPSITSSVPTMNADSADDR